MSPEQVTGGQVDHRSDIFSLGCVLYEMVSGRRPFEADTEVEVTAAILLEEPPQLSSTGASLPVELEQTIHRCLEKSPEARYQSAADLAFALRSIGTGSAVPMARPVGEIRARRARRTWWLAAAAAAVVVTAATVAWLQRGEREPAPTELELDPRRVVVAPLENRTGDPTLDMVGMMAADLIVQRFTETGAAEAVPMEAGQAEGGSQVLRFAREQGVALTLSGASYLDGETLRLQARLVEVATGDLIYAFEPVTAARDAATDAINALGERVLAAVAAHVNNPLIDISVMTPPASFEAFQALERWEEMLGAGNPEAIKHIRRALELDPGFHWARIEAVWDHLMRPRPDREGAGRELAAVEEQLDRMTPFEQRYAGYLRSYVDQDWPAALRAIRGLVKRAPNVGWLKLDLACRAIEMNRPAEAVEALETLVGSFFPSHYQSAWWPIAYTTAAYHMMGDFERELEYANLGLERFPGMAMFFFQKARALAAMGQTRDIETVVAEFLRVQTRGLSAGFLLGRTAIELREHGYRQASDGMAIRSVEWYETHPSAILETSADSWTFGYALGMVGRLDDLEGHVVRLIEAQPNDRNLTGWLAVVTAMKGDEERAKRILRDLPANDDPDGPAWKLYWGAAVEAHLGDSDRAVALLAEAFSNGVQYDIVALGPEDFQPLWDYPPYQEMMKPKG
jgi:tetratricopeptide (TPR) repeat protein